MTSHLNVTVIISNVCSIENDTAFLFSMLSFLCHFFLDLQYIELFCVMYSVYCKSNFLRIAFSVITAYDQIINEANSFSSQINIHDELSETLPLIRRYTHEYFLGAGLRNRSSGKRPYIKSTTAKGSDNKRVPT